MPKLEMSKQRTRNPAGNGSYSVHTIQPPSPTVKRQQDSKHNKTGFMRDLEKVTRRKPKV